MTCEHKWHKWIGDVCGLCGISYVTYLEHEVKRLRDVMLSRPNSDHIPSDGGAFDEWILLVDREARQ